ncbi:PAS domain S-box protein [Aquisphaera giovannonii]|nr:PAS domain S-box protein [Aquisphaera giovannonii]
MKNKSNGGPAAAQGPGTPGAATDLDQIRAVADFIPQLAWSCLPDGRCDYLNSRWVEYTGVPEERHHGLGWLDAVHPEDRDRSRRVWEAYIAGEGEYDVDYRLRRHDGAYRWFKARGHLVRSREGEPVRVLGTTTDVDDHRRVEERLEAALAASGTGTFRWDIRTNALDWDEQLDRLFGLEPGRTVRSLDGFIGLVHPGDRAQVLERCRRCKEEGADFAMEFRVVWPDGSVRWLDDRGRTFRDQDGRPEYVTGACVDVTERRRSDERSEFIRQASGVGFWYCDLPFDELEWDERVREHFYIPPDARVTMDTFYGRLHPDDRAPTREAIERSIAGRTQYDVHYRTVDPATHAERWVRAIGRTYYGPDGMPRRFDGLTLDVTDRMRANEELRASEERFRAFMDHSPAAGWVTDADGRIQYVSASYARLFKMPDRAPIGALPADLYPAEFADEAVRNTRAVADSGRPRESLERCPRPDGSVGEFLVYKFPLPGGRIGGVAVDITERLRAEEALREAEATLRAFFDASPVMMGLVELPEDGDILHLYDDAAACQFFGVGPGGTAGRRASELGAPPSTIAEWRARYLQSDSARQPVRFDYEHDSPGGRRWLSCVVAPLGAGAAGRPRFSYVAEDVTERKRAEEALREADRRKDEFLALLAHELRNPLAPLRNGLQVLRLAGENAEASRKAREMMERQLGHMVRLIDDLMDVSRISRNKMELRRGKVPLADVVSAAVETARPALDQAGHEFRVALPPEPVYLDADLTRLAQVFANLLTNAAKYTEPGGRVTLAAEVRDGDVSVEVSDSGIGIPAESLPRIFDMFSQVDRSIERKAGGLGIGLALVKGLVEMHGGGVTARSGGPGRGSAFTVTLPVIGGPRERAAAEGQATPGRMGPGRRILVVDDNRDSAGSMAEMLSLLGHEVRQAHDGLEAVEAARAFRPDLVLMDVGMPRINGYEATRRIRAIPSEKSPTIVALTGWGQEGDRARSQAAGCDGHLVKPVDWKDLSPYVDRPTDG